jgi:hypothetical protein
VRLPDIAFSGCEKSAFYPGTYSHGCEVSIMPKFARSGGIRGLERGVAAAVPRWFCGELQVL